MKLWNKIISTLRQNNNSAQLIIIQKNSDGPETKEYDSIEKAIADFENDINIPKEKLEQLRKSLDSLKHKSTIRIRNGEIVD